MRRITALPTQLLLPFVVAFAACSSDKNKPADTTAIADTTVPVVETAASTTPSASSTSVTGAAIVPININTATDAEILAIPGMGPRMLREFKEYRPYTSIEQFRREIGKYVDKAEVARLEKYIVIK
ncbi:MAG: ComEA family DNA-binding protein [Gemmatimonadaceae bacterium]